MADEEDALFSTIVVGVDGREGGRDALVLGDRLRRLFGGKLVAVTAYSGGLFAGRGVTPDFETALHRNATDLVLGEVEAAGVQAHAVAMHDSSPGRALHAAAKWHRADVIVVGSAPRGPIGRVLAGDVTAGTLHGARCPVVVAPRRYADHATDIEMIGVGYDASPEARAAATLAGDLAVAAGATLRVICVVEPPVPGGTELGSERAWREDPEAARTAAQAEVDDVIAQLGDVAAGEVVLGDAVGELSRAANELDLLVTGSRNYGPIRRVVLGSTSSKLVHEAPCPVMVLARGASEHPAESAVAEIAQRASAG